MKIPNTLAGKKREGIQVRRFLMILAVTCFMILMGAASCRADTYLELSGGENMPLIDVEYANDENCAWGFILWLGYKKEGLAYGLGTSFSYYNNGADSSGLYEGLRFYTARNPDEPNQYSLGGFLGYSWRVRDGGLRFFVETGMQWSTDGVESGWEPVYGVGVGIRL